MIRKSFFVLIVLCIVFLNSCETVKYVHDQESRKRQNELIRHRSGNRFSDIALTFVSLIILSISDIDTEYNPRDREFKRLKLINPTKDTIYVNMLTDIYWDINNYCDFMDIRIPPQQKCKILVPVDALYNIYFSNTPTPDDDEMLEIFSSDVKRLSLYPGLTDVADSIHLNQ